MGFYLPMIKPAVAVLVCLAAAGCATTTAGTAVLTTRDARELPPEIYEVALITARQWAKGNALDQQAGIQYLKTDGFEVGFDFVGLRDLASPLPPFAKSVLDGYR